MLKKPRLQRSNSQNQLGQGLSIADRKTSHTALKKVDVKDYSVIAAFSREAFINFGKKWKTTMRGGSMSQVTKSSRRRVDPAEAAKLLSLQSKAVVGTDFEAQVQGLLESKTIPHVVAVIEGKQEARNFSLKVKVDDQSIDALYSRVMYSQGTNAEGSKDNKQSMSVYVREDMKEVYTVTEEKIEHGNGKLIHSLGVNYQTEDGTAYRTLLVHIPNEFVGTSLKNADTHKAFEKYARNLGLAKSPVVVTTYFGDTNYATPMREFSVASMGGIASTGYTLNPQGSAAQKETNFMQSVSLGKDRGKHSVLQPSTLNYVFITPDSTNREVTDHPSIMQYVAHDSLLNGQKNSDFDFFDI